MLTKLFCKVRTLVTEFKNDERGVTAIEYGLIAVAMAAALTYAFGDGGDIIAPLQGAFSEVVTALGGTSTAP